MTDYLEIDGSRGEGGGQILRTSLTLAVMTQRPIHLTRIRAHRSKPGLQRQHLVCVEAAAAICNATVRGGVLGATELFFEAGPVQSGDWTFPIGSAGSVGLVLQTVLVPLLSAPGPSRLIIEGGTHNSMAPPFEFLARVYVPALQRMGARVRIELDRHGFYPAGGGRIVAHIEPSTLGVLDLVDVGPVTRRSARAVIAQLPRHIAERELAVVRDMLGWSEAECAIEEVESHGPGNAMVLEVERDGSTEIVSGFGEKGLPAERVADRAAREMASYLAAGVPVGEHLADQLMLPVVLAGRGRYRTVPLSPHATTNLDTIRLFRDVQVAVTAAPGGVDVTLGRWP